MGQRHSLSAITTPESLPTPLPKGRRRMALGALPQPDGSLPCRRYGAGENAPNPGHAHCSTWYLPPEADGFPYRYFPVRTDAARAPQGTYRTTFVLDFQLVWGDQAVHSWSEVYPVHRQWPENKGTPLAQLWYRANLLPYPYPRYCALGETSLLLHHLGRKPAYQEQEFTGIQGNR